MGDSDWLDASSAFGMALSPDGFHYPSIGLHHYALRKPDRIAIRIGDRSLTYGELESRVGSLARCVLEDLTDLGEDIDRSDLIVPVFVDRGIESVVALHAMLRTGVGFALLDSALPASVVADRWERIGRPSMAVDACASLPMLPVPLKICHTSRAGDSLLSPRPVDPDRIGAVIFTSGSTGSSKGVVYDARMFAALMQRLVQINDGAGDRMATLGSPLDFLAGLQAAIRPAIGESLLIVEPSKLDPLAYLELLDRWMVEFITTTPSQVRASAGRWARGRRLEHVRLISTFGEPLVWDDVAALRAISAPETTVSQTYGATEAPGGVLEYVIGPDEELGTGPVPTGRPVSMGRVRFDSFADAERPQELLVHGPLARGYLGDPDLTRERFGVAEDGSRFWRSGDLFEPVGDGIYTYRARVDDLLKVNGRLVEPAQVERALLSVKGIAKAVVLARRSGSGRTTIVGHVERSPGVSLTVPAIRTQIAGMLPAELVPGRIIVHGILPLNERGKVDRAALGAAADLGPTTSRPPDDLEAFVVTCAREVLGSGGVDLDEDLWDAGLDSLGALELISMFADEGFGLVDPSLLATNRTAAQIAKRLRSATSRRRSEVVVLNESNTGTAVICVPGAGSSALRFVWLANELKTEIPLVVVEARGTNTRRRPDRTVVAMSERVAEVARSWRPDGEVMIMGHSAGGAVAWEAARILRAEGRQVRVILLDGVVFDSPKAASDELNRPQRSAVSILLRYMIRPPRANWDAIKRRLNARWLVSPLRPTRRDRDHYVGLYWVGRRAGANHQVGPADFPVLSLHPEGSPYVGRLPILPTGSATFTVGGDHGTMLEPPHVGLVARHVADFNR